MSNIPASKRPTSRVDFFKKAIDLRAKIVDYLNVDFNSDKKVDEEGWENEKYWVIVKVRNSIYEYARQMVENCTQANTIRIGSLYEYNERRRYMTAAIGNCESINQEIQFSIRYLNIKPNKYMRLIKEILLVRDSIRNWRKSDNKVKNKLLSNK